MSAIWTRLTGLRMCESWLWMRLVWSRPKLRKPWAGVYWSEFRLHQLGKHSWESDCVRDCLDGPQANDATNQPTAYGEQGSLLVILGRSGKWPDGLLCRVTVGWPPGEADDFGPKLYSTWPCDCGMASGRNRRLGHKLDSTWPCDCGMAPGRSRRLSLTVAWVGAWWRSFFQRVVVDRSLVYVGQVMY